MGAPYALDDERVVVIVGSGAGGGTLGTELALRGIDTVILEAGPRLAPADFENDEWRAFTQLSWLDPRTASGSWQIAKDSPGLPAWIVKAVGGSTVHWAGASLRLQAHEFRARTTYGEIAGAALADWPITLADLAPWYERAEARLGVTRTHGIPGLPGNNNFKVMKAGADKLGYRECHTGRMAINPVARDGRPACRQAGFCMQGCKFAAKWSTLYAEIPRGEATGRLEVRPGCQALRIEHDAAGNQVNAVVYADPQGVLQKQRARVVCIAGNSIESPRLLLNSTSSRFPHGLANGAGQIGRHFMRHVSGAVFAAFDQPVHMYRGTTMAGIITDESGHDPARGFAGGYEIETLSLGLAFFAAFHAPGTWGRDFTSVIEDYAHLAGVWVVGEDLPRVSNRITLNPDVRDRFGLPVADLHYDDHANDIAMRAHGYGRAGALFETVGARRVIVWPPLPSTHNLGTNRMSAAPGAGVVDAWGRAHEIDNLFVSDGSQFPTSGAENPTLTIVALALRQADHIAKRMTAREL